MSPGKVSHDEFTKKIFSGLSHGPDCRMLWLRRCDHAVTIDGMAKRKQSDQGNEPMPVEAPAPPKEGRSGSRHRPRKMVPLVPWVYRLLQRLAKSNDRPATWELRHLVIQAAIAAGYT